MIAKIMYIIEGLEDKVNTISKKKKKCERTKVINQPTNKTPYLKRFFTVWFHSFLSCQYPSYNLLL